MDKFQQLKSHLELDIVPECARACQAAPYKSRKDATKELARIRDIVEREVLSPLQALGHDSCPRKERQAFEQSVRGLIAYLEEKMSRIFLGHRIGKDLELGLEVEAAREDASVEKWAWLDEREAWPKVPGAWPEN
jgi:hypothetical protein